MPIPQTWENFKYVVFGEQFTGTFHDRPSLGDSVRLVLAETWQQLGVLLPLALIGLVVGFLRRAPLMVMLVLWFGVTWYFALGYENADIGRYYLVPLMCVAVVGGLGAGAILEAAKGLVQRVAPARRPLGRTAVAALLAVVLIVPAVASVPGRFNGIDESTRSTARDGGSTSLGAALPQDSVVVSWWSFSTPMWYAPVRRGLAARRDDHRRPHDPRSEPRQRPAGRGRLPRQATGVPDPATRRLRAVSRSATSSSPLPGVDGRAGASRSRRATPESARLWAAEPEPIIAAVAVAEPP